MRHAHPAPRTLDPKSNGSGLKRDRVYDALLLDIICSKIPPGAPIDEAGVARRYRAGKAAGRDALRRLALEGMVSRRPRLGTTIAEMSVMELQQVFELRVQLEVHCAVLAARMASAAETAAIRDAYRQAAEALEAKDYRALVCMDQAFHRSVARASHNEWLVRIVTLLHNSALRFWHFALPRRPAAALHEEVDYHLRVADAIERRDATGAQAAMRAVLGQFPDTVKGVLEHAAQEW